MITSYTGVSGSRTSYLISRQLAETNKALVVVSNGRAAARLAEDLAFFLPDVNTIVMPESEDLHILYEARSRDTLTGRIQAIQALCEKGGRAVVIAPVSAAVKMTVSPDRFMSSVISIGVGDVMDPEDLRLRLFAAGYIPSSVTEAQGEFSKRGGIIDVFPPAQEYPVRVEFFGDEIDSIRFYDQDTQRTIENTMQVVLSPAAEFIPDNGEKEKALKRLIKEYDRRIRNVRSEYADPDVADGRIERLQEYKGKVLDMFEDAANVQIYSDYIEYFDVEKCFLWDYAQDGTIIIRDPARVEEELTSPEQTANYRRIYESRNVAVITPFPERIPGVEKLDRIVNVRSRQIAPFNGQIDLTASYHAVRKMSTT